MSHLRCRYLDAAVLLVAITATERAWGQACCAGGSVVTPGRLELHEDALVGTQLRAATVTGSYDTGGHYLASPSGDLEGDFEEDVFGAVRFFRRGQAALLVPIVQTYRRTPRDGGHFGGGIGDINASVRWDFLVAGESQVVPGIALLAGVSFPSGKPPEQASAPLVVDATGLGAFQGNAALALEQTFGPWLVNATAMVAGRAPHGGEQLGAQVTFLAAGAYTFDNDMAIALSASYAFEGDATASDGSTIPMSSRRLTTLSVSGLWPFADSWRLLGGLFLEPPVDWVGSNQPASSGFTLTLIRSWS
jgi:hypothetical protein